jgi:DNA repair exonuclease SbcCD ATPase subunit
MHLQFKSIHIVRFRSFLKEATLHFDDCGSGLYFLRGKNEASEALGSNGAGKSTIVDSLFWCLYGKTVQGLKNPDVIPWSGKGKTEVEVTIQVDDITHKIKRTIGPNLLTIDDKEAGQDYVNELIGIPFEILPYTIILGQRKPLFFDLTASEKLKLFGEVLQLERWDKRSDHASETVKSLESEIASTQNELDSCLNQLATADSDFKALKQQSSEWEAKRAERLANADKELLTLRKQIESVANERDTADLKLERAETELKALNPLLGKLCQEERTLSHLVVNLLKDEKQAEEKMIALEKQLTSFESKICPTCSQPLQTHDQIIKLKKDIKIQIKQLGLADIQDARAEASANYSKLEAQLNIQEQAKEQFENDAREARDVLDRLVPRISEWQAQVKAIEKSLQEFEKNNNPYTEQLQTLRRRRDISKANGNKYEETIKTKTEYCERVRFWIKGFKDIKLLVVEEILQELEITSNAMTEESGLIGWQIQYDIERETKSKTIARGLNILILSPANKQPVKWECWSGGEAQRLRLIGTAALSSVLLNHVGASCNLTFYDEPTIGLSKEGIKDLVGLLTDQAIETKRSVWFVDHHVVESNKFVKVVQVIKDKQGSYINEMVQ